MALTAFRIGELERKMQAAAAALDFEHAIELRDKIRDLKAKLASETPAPPPKVVDIATRAEFVAPKKRRPKKAKPFVDKDGLEVLETMLQETKAGRLVGIAAVGGRVDRVGRVDDIECFVSGPALDYTRLFVGGCQTLAHDLLSIEADTFDEEFDEE